MSQHDHVHAHDTSAAPARHGDSFASENVGHGKRRRLGWLWWLPLPLVVAVQWLFPGLVPAVSAASCPTCGVCGGGVCGAVSTGHLAHVGALLLAWLGAAVAALRAVIGTVLAMKHRWRRRVVFAGLTLALGAGLTSDFFPQVDLPGPPARFEEIRAGSLVIAMDNTHQALVTPFNTRAYGLAIELLNADIPLKWVIRAGKGKDDIDFSAQTIRVAPSLDTAPTVRDFRAGPLVVPQYFAPQAMAIVQAFNARGGNVAVYELLHDEVLDVRYDIAFKPRVLVGSSNTGIHTSILMDAWVPASNYGSAEINDVNIGAFTCASLVTEPHNSSNAGVAAVSEFVAAGGNFLAQCASVLTYENDPLGGFQTSAGISGSNVSTVMTYPNPDLAITQFDGVLEPAPGGSEQDWRLNLGSLFRNGGHPIAQNAGVASDRYALTAAKLYGDAGGMVFYLGGHEYKGSDIGSINGHRVLLNAMLIPATRDVTCQIQVPLETDIGVTKTVDQERVTYGDTVTFTVTVALGGPGNASGVEVVDQLPSGYAYVDHSASHGAYDPASGVWSIGGLSWSDPMLPTTATLTISAEVLEGGEYRNTATVTLNEDDADLADNVAWVEPIVVGPNDADLALVKSVGNANPVDGSLVVYTFTVRNDGPGVATDVVVTDPLPAGLTFVSSRGGCAESGGVVTCGAASLGVGATVGFDVTLRVDALPGSVLTNTASVVAEQRDPDVRNNESSAEVVVSVAQCPAGFGGVPRIGWAVGAVEVVATVENPANAIGPLAAPGTSLSTAIAARLRNAGAILELDLGTVVPGGSSVVLSLASRSNTLTRIEASLTGAGGTFTSLGTFGGLGGTLGQSPASDVGVHVSVTVPAGGARFLRFVSEAGSEARVDGIEYAFACDAVDVGVSKVVEPARVQHGEVVTFTVTVSLLGLGTATGVEVVDQLPSGYAYLGHSVSAGVFDPGSGSWWLGTMAPGGVTEATLVISAEVLPLGAYRNTASATLYEVDVDPSNDVAWVEPIVFGPDDVDLALAKTVNVTDPEPDTLITYTLIVDNAGPAVATNLVVTDVLPAGVAFVSASTGCSAVGGVVTCTAPTLNAGAQRTFQVTVRVDSLPGSVLTNTASVSSDNVDYDLSNNVASVDVTVSVVRCPVGFEPVAQTGWAVAAQVIATTVDNAANAVGDLTAAGTTAGNANSARLRAGGILQVDLGSVAPGGSELILSLASRPASRFEVQASLTGTAGTFVSLGTFGGGGTLGQSPSDDELVRILVTVPGGGVRYLRFAREAGDRNYVDGVEYASACGLEVARADLTIAKTPSIDGPEPGDQVTYALVVTNAGPRDATGVQVLDTLPAGVTYVSASAECILLAATLICEIPVLADGASATFTVTVEVGGLPLGTELVNGASVSANEEDPVMSNNVATALVTVSGLELRKSVCNVTESGGCADPTDFVASASGVPGDVLEYRVTFERFGPPVFDLELADDVPPEAVFVVDAYGPAQDVRVTCPDASIAFVTTGPTTALTFDLADACELDTATRADGVTVSEALLPGQAGEFRFRVAIP